MLYHRGPQREAPHWVIRWREREERWQKLLLWFPQEGMGEAGEVGLGLANLNNFSRLWGTRAVPGCLAPGPRVTRAEE